MGEHNDDPPKVGDRGFTKDQGSEKADAGGGFVPISGEPEPEGSECLTIYIRGEALTINRKTTAGDIKEQIGADSDSLLATRDGNDIGTFNDGDRIADYVDDGAELLVYKNPIAG